MKIRYCSRMQRHTYSTFSERGGPESQDKARNNDISR
jgi:hypothetical protein